MRGWMGWAVGEAVVRVNGVKLGATDLKLVTGAMGHGGEGGRINAAALEGLVLQEVLAQKALALGLDKDPQVAEALRNLEAQVALVRRRELGRALYRKEVEPKAQVTDAEVKASFEAHTQQLRTHHRVQQILRRNRADIEAVQKKLDGGQAFEDVARDGYPALQEGAVKPWEMGAMTFRQLPAPWRPVLEKLPVGGTTDIIEGEAGRFWIIHLVDRSESEAVTLESQTAALREQLKEEKLEKGRAELEKSLRASAKVEYPK